MGRRPLKHSPTQLSFLASEESESTFARGPDRLGPLLISSSESNVAGEGFELSAESACVGWAASVNPLQAKLDTCCRRRTTDVTTTYGGLVLAVNHSKRGR